MSSTPQQSMIDPPPPAEGSKAVVVGRIKPQKAESSPVPPPATKAKVEPGGYRHVRPSIAVEFQPDAIEIEEAPPPRMAFYMLYALLSCLIVFGLWASFAEVDRIVASRGKVTSSSANVVLQPLETSVIRKIEVKSGDVVHKGDLLVTLDPTFTNADLNDLGDKQRSYQAEIDRLEHEIEGTTYPLTPSPNADEQLQYDLYQRRMASYREQVTSYEQEIERARSQFASAESDIGILRQRMQVAGEIERMRDKLRQQEVGSQLNLLIARNDRLAITRDLERARNAQIDADHMIQATQAKLRAFVEGWRQDAATKLVTTRRDANQVAEQLNKARLRRDMVTLNAPMDGIVLSTIRRSAGAVVQQGDMLVTLVPLNAPVELEVRIPASDIGFLTVGNNVRIKLDAYPYVKHGTVEGELEALNHDTIRDQNEPNTAPFYQGRVRITKAELIKVPDNFQLIPGMTATAEILIGKRSILSYLLYPLISSIDSGLRDSSM
jgi:hemolysin D